METHFLLTMKMIHPKNKIIMEASIFMEEEASEPMVIIPISIEKTDEDELRIDIPLKDLKEGVLFLSIDHLEQAIRITKERYDID